MTESKGFGRVLSRARAEAEHKCNSSTSTLQYPLDMAALKCGAALLIAALFVFFLHQHGEFHLATGTLALKDSSGHSPLACVDAADIDPVMDLVLLPSGGVLVASMSANSSQPGRISLLPSVTFSPESGAPELRSVSFSGFSAQSLRPLSMHLFTHSEGSLLFVVQQWPATNTAFERYMQQRGVKVDEGLPQPLTTVEVFLVMQDQATEVQLVHQRSLQHGSLQSITSVVALSPKQLFVASSCYSHAAPGWRRTLEAVTSLACCSKIWLLDVDCGSEENCFDTHLGGELTGSALGCMLLTSLLRGCTLMTPLLLVRVCFDANEFCSFGRSRRTAQRSRSFAYSEQAASYCS